MQTNKEFDLMQTLENSSAIITNDEEPTNNYDEDNDDYDIFAESEKGNIIENNPLRQNEVYVSTIDQSEMISQSV
jgi:hypothetical protein